MFIRPLRFLALAAAFTLTAATAPGAMTTTPVTGSLPEEARQALHLCATDLQSALARSSLPKDQPIAILPVRGDSGGYVIGALKNAATGAGLTCVEGKEDPFFEEVAKEIAWDERKDDILDPATLAKFGKLKGAKLLMYAFIREMSAGPGRGYVELEVHVSSIETKQHLWGQSFARRFYSASELVGLVDLDPDVRQLVRTSFDRAATGLKTAGKLKDTRTVAIVPLAGDTDRFITGLAESMVSKTQLMPKQLDTTTLGETRALLRENPQAADAVMFGAVRDLSRKTLASYPDRTEYTIISAIQLTIQDTRTGNVLWSDLVEGQANYVTKLTWWEMTRKYGPLVVIHSKVMLLALLVLVGLVVLALFMRAMRRAR
jgi:hypothetical protein